MKKTLITLVSLALFSSACTIPPSPPEEPPATTTTTVTVPPPSTTTTTPETEYSRRFFSPEISWNRPAAEFGDSERWTEEYVKRFWRHAGGEAPPGTISLAVDDYSVPIYDTQDSNITARVFQQTAMASQQSFSQTGIKVGATIPYNRDWKPGGGNDNSVIIVNRQTGEVWELWGVGQSGYSCSELFGAGPNGRAGHDPTQSRHLCLFAVNYWTGLYTAGQDDLISGRGAGIPKLAMVTTADEVTSGRIRHALQMTITNTMHGPDVGPDDPRAGITAGFYLEPATRVEFVDPQMIAKRCGGRTTQDHRLTIPEGMRFRVDVTDTQIEDWLDQRGFEGAKRDTARIFAVAMREYGFIPVETGCYGATIQTTGFANPREATIWRGLGLSPNDRTLLDELITADNLEVVNAP